jgi:hypothetical protein
VTTAFKTIVDQVVALLLQAPQITGSRVYSGRVRPMPTEHASDISVSIERSAGEQFAIGGGPVRWDVMVMVVIRARGAAATDAMAAVDPLLEAAYARLAQASAPAGVEGWAVRVQPAIDIDEADTPVAAVALQLSIQFRTQPGTLALAA